jgi:D-sedoheptulose 7-phosphate isomerase
VAFSGSGGGALARSSAVDYCFTTPADYIPRIQEAHATAWHALLGALRTALAEAAIAIPVADERSVPEDAV